MALNSVGEVRLGWQGASDRRGSCNFRAMDSDPVRFPTRNLIFDDVRFVGFGWTDGNLVSLLHN